MEIIPIISVSIAFIGLVIALLKFIQENRKIRNENEKLKKKLKSNLWLPKDDIEVLKILKEINGYKVKEEKDWEENRKDFGSFCSSGFSPMTKEQKEKYEKEKLILDEFLPLENDIILFSHDIYSMFGYSLTSEIEEFFIEATTNIKFILPMPESIMDGYKTLKEEKQKQIEQKREERRKENRHRGFDFDLDFGSLRQNIAMHKYDKLNDVIYNIIWISKKFKAFEKKIYFHNYFTDFEFIKMKNKIIYRESKNNDWQYLDDIEKISITDNSHKQIINSIIDGSSIIPYSNLDVSSLWKKSLNYLFKNQYDEY